MTRRVCPLCVVREAGVIDPGCIICDGHGTIELGARGTAYFDPAVVSTAVHLAIETQARVLHETTTRSQDPTDGIRTTLTQLARAGLINPPKRPAPHPTGPTGVHPGPAAMIVHRTTGRPPTRTDQLMIRAAPYPYTMADRPGARGLPLFSRNFHPSSLAVICDPQPFDTTTQEQTLNRAKRDHDARVLVAAATTRKKP